ncbi:hypothetical protein H5203_18505 [Pseudoalteromonas sp. SG41-1]|uniref:hypothetical protein n=1 Tax=Pseudoalteromonas sp. SG41-1 TaxID=2760979 RepID=UPI00160101DC|nr:hypothetical protein [Pseudoalteromonas sp. SG41-1]MBB1507459.1 hypothetical protein [Pseudoalteromonas sp. SG41-1]
MDFLRNNFIRVPILLYLVGFVVHNSYLASYGSYEFELVEARYMLTGFGSVFIFTSMFLFVFYRTNISDVSKSYEPKILFPWLLRISSIPAGIYSILHSADFLEFPFSAFGAYMDLGIYIFYSSFALLAIEVMRGKRFQSKLLKILIYIITIPFIALLFFASGESELLGQYSKFTLYFFLGAYGIAISQDDERKGVQLNHLDLDSDPKHEKYFSLMFAFLCLGYGLFQFISIYSNNIYPYIPTALGGSKVVNATLYLADSKAKVKIIQEGHNWFLIYNEKTSTIEKVKSSEILKVEYHMDKLPKLLK